MEKMKVRKEVIKRYFKLNFGLIDEKSPIGTGQFMNFNHPAFNCIYADNDFVIWMVQDDKYLHKLGIPFAGVLKLKLFSCVYPNAEGYLIIVDKFYNQLPDEVKQFMIGHEIGHMVNKHLDNDKSVYINTFIKRPLGFVPEMEFEADKYAASEFGVDVVINSLKYLLKYTDMGFINKIEYYKRIKRLSK